MQDICKAAAVSPGALYVYFDNKEALIAGICERDRIEFAEQFAAVAGAPDFLEALGMLGDHYFSEEREHKWALCVEIGLESTRNPRIGEIVQRFDAYVRESFRAVFQRLEKEGRIAPGLDIDAVTRAFTLVADGVFWRRAVDPTFDPATAMPIVLELIGRLLNPVTAGSGGRSERRGNPT